MEEPPLYQIVDWNKYFENNKSREVGRCGFVCFPNRHGGIGISNVLSEPDGAAVYGIWALIVQFCSRQTKREGWLTSDGTRDGFRIGAAAFARTFRRPVDEIYRTLQVVSYPDIGWLKLVEGKHEWSEKTAKILAAIPVADIGRQLPPPNVGSDHQTGEVSGNQDDASATSGDTDCRPTSAVTALKEGRNEGNRANKTFTTATPLLSQFSQSQKCEKAKREGLGEAEAKAWLNDIFGNEMPWTYEEMLLLDELIPIPFDVHRLLDWAYRLPRDNPIHEMTKLRQKRVSLLRDFGGEADKVRMVRKQMGYGELVTTKNGAKPGNG